MYQYVDAFHINYLYTYIYTHSDVITAATGTATFSRRANDL